MGQLLRKYEGEVQRLRAAWEADRRELQQQLAAAAQPQQQASAQPAAMQQQPSLDSAAWAALLEDPSQQPAPQLQEAGAQTEAEEEQQPARADPALLEAARLEIERLQDVNASLMEAQARGEGERLHQRCA